MQFDMVYIANTLKQKSAVIVEKLLLLHDIIIQCDIEITSGSLVSYCDAISSTVVKDYT